MPEDDVNGYSSPPARWLGKDFSNLNLGSHQTKVSIDTLHPVNTDPGVDWFTVAYQSEHGKFYRIWTFSFQ